MGVLHRNCGPHEREASSCLASTGRHRDAATAYAWLGFPCSVYARHHGADWSLVCCVGQHACGRARAHATCKHVHFRSLSANQLGPSAARQTCFCSCNDVLNKRSHRLIKIIPQHRASLSLHCMAARTILQVVYRQGGGLHGEQMNKYKRRAPPPLTALHLRWGEADDTRAAYTAWPSCHAAVRGKIHVCQLAPFINCIKVASKLFWLAAAMPIDQPCKRL